MIWYQGESNGDRLSDALEYETLFPRLIKDWREKWKVDHFAFLFVQLTNFRAGAKQPVEGIWPWVREAQTKTLKLPKTGMAVTIDVGDSADIHPKSKKEVGNRLALAALNVAYGKDLAFSGPLYKSMQVKGNRTMIRFHHVAQGLIMAKREGPELVKEDSLKGFVIAGPDQKFVWAQAIIKGNSVIVWSDAVPHPVAVRYNWADNPGGNLYNSAGLPASPFRTDNWIPQPQ